VARVLCPGGHFLYADFRACDGIAAWEAALANAPMRMRSQSEVNAEVMRRMEKNSQQWLDMMNRCVPAFLRGLARDNAGVRGLGDLPAKRGTLVPDVLLRQGMRRRPVPGDPSPP
jgi:hypothetical protein